MRFISGQLSSSLSSEKPKLDAETYEKRLKECVKAGLDDIEYNLLKEENIILACMAYLLAVDWAEEFHERSSGKKFQSPEETLNTLAELSGKDIEAVTKLYNKFSTEYIEHARPNIYRNMIDVVTALHEEFMGDPWVILKVGVFEEITTLLNVRNGVNSNPYSFSLDEILSYAQDIWKKEPTVESLYRETLEVSIQKYKKQLEQDPEPSFYRSKLALAQTELWQLGNARDHSYNPYPNSSHTEYPSPQENKKERQPSPP